MQRWRGLDMVPDGWGRCVVTIGVFDGLHRGHELIVRTAVGRARALRVPALMMTFDPHPAEVLRPGSHPPELTTLRRRADLAEELGVDVFLAMPFTTALQTTSAESFVHEILVETLHVAEVVVGEDFRFGHRGAGSLELLVTLGERWGFGATGVSLLGDGAMKVSSTYVRAAIAAGDVTAAAAALGRLHRVEGVVVHGDGRGAGLGIPTANLDPTPHAAIPADGVYACWFNLGTRRSPAAVSVGTNPTFEGKERRVEAFVLDGGGNFYGRRIALDFVERLRGMEKYDTVEALMAQIEQDVARTHEVLGTTPG